MPNQADPHGLFAWLDQRVDLPPHTKIRNLAALDNSDLPTLGESNHELPTSYTVVDHLYARLRGAVGDYIALDHLAPNEGPPKVCPPYHPMVPTDHLTPDLAPSETLRSLSLPFFTGLVGPVQDIIYERQGSRYKRRFGGLYVTSYRAQKAQSDVALHIHSRTSDWVASLYSDMTWRQVSGHLITGGLLPDKVISAVDRLLNDGEGYIGREGVNTREKPSIETLEDTAAERLLERVSTLTQSRDACHDGLNLLQVRHGLAQAERKRDAAPPWAFLTDTKVWWLFEVVRPDSTTTTSTIRVQKVPRKTASPRMILLGLAVMRHGSESKSEEHSLTLVTKQTESDFEVRMTCLPLPEHAHRT